MKRRREGPTGTCPSAPSIVPHRGPGDSGRPAGLSMSYVIHPHSPGGSHHYSPSFKMQ